MKYTPGLPTNNNVSHEHPLREFFVLLGGAVGAQYEQRIGFITAGQVVKIAVLPIGVIGVTTALTLGVS